jgi:UDP-glucose 4-epimerase
MVADEIPTKIEQSPARTGDVASATVTSEKAEKLIGWRAEVDFRTGLKELIQHHLSG